MKIDSIKIKFLMTEQNLRQIDLATKCSISRQNISATLSRGTCTLEKVLKISNALGVSATEIIKM